MSEFNYVGGPSQSEELWQMSEKELRAIKTNPVYSEAKGNTNNHKVFVQVDRILLAREGIGWCPRV